jgi:hypothetical protein
VGERLAEQVASPVGVTGLAAGEEHAGPFEAGAGQPCRRADAQMHRLGAGEVCVGLAETAQRRRQDTQIEVNRSDCDDPGGDDLTAEGGHESEEMFSFGTVAQLPADERGHGDGPGPGALRRKVVQYGGETACPRHPPFPLGGS